MMHRRTYLIGVLAALTPAACDTGAPYELVVDLRVLAIQAEPPEIRAGSSGDVTFRALVADPRGQAVGFTWGLCPVESSTACMDYDELRQAAPEPMRAGLDSLRGITTSGTASPGSDARGRALPYEVVDFAVAIPPSLFAYHEATNQLGYGTGAWPSAVLDLAGEDMTLKSYKRVVLGAAGPLPANRNPVFERLQLAEGELAAGAAFADITGDVTLGILQSVRIRPVFTADSVESYQAIQVDLQSGEISMSDRQEELSVSWFTTAGELRDQLTSVAFTRDFDTVYTAPPIPPVGNDGWLTVWMVARDQRGGVAWQGLQIQIVLE